MTCIVAIADGDRGVIMAADGQATADDFTIPRATPKIHCAGNYLIGASGPARTGDLVCYAFDPPPPPPPDAQPYALPALLTTAFVDRLRAVFREGGAMKTEDGVDNTDTVLLVGVQGRVFVVYQDLSVVESTRGYAAIGSGHEIASGALAALRIADPLGSPAHHAQTALRIAADFIASVGRPFSTLGPL